MALINVLVYDPDLGTNFLPDWREKQTNKLTNFATKLINREMFIKFYKTSFKLLYGKYYKKCNNI